MGARIVGWGHTEFGRLKDDLEQLIVRSAREAIEHAGVDPTEIDGIWMGHYNGGLVNDGFPSSLALQIDPKLRFTPSTRLENACASGSAAIHGARNAINSGNTKIALVIGVEKMTGKDTKGVTESLMTASYQAEESEVSFPQVFSRFAHTYFQKYGNKSEILARIAAKNHKNSVHNPLAQMQKDVGFEFCNTISDKNPLVASPLRLTDCSLVSDGAAALVMVSDELEENFGNSVKFRSAVQVNDFLPMSSRDILKFEGPAKAFSDAYKEAGITLDDVDFAEVHDCFTIAELLVYEAMGLTKLGQGDRAILDGTVYSDGILPVNLSGGLKAKGHPVGATGVSMHALTSAQLTGQAGAMQKKNANIGCIFNMGGSGVANYCSILEASK
ncbi:MAG: acetyl-CoA acetyltransferase [Rhodobacteraceae bacterium]|jgi:acetyl-CoA C-acetyltransferase|nr:acetyl-CoA acetyltransferase [Paracoccaceae bacterium]MAT00151.1 acetyl-CoA acetyltransferase [Paracoccaceae bacterium]MBL6856521.1 acetyl-CoA acetyltransferase [Paracoccaceae bacterium]MBV04245.1 acetyl-CoA acetyltransferase [Paracoccaceae bacterium]MDG1878969.1 acetyl-CoA acetyltransferase [Paracoccaceae bacterium]|tara:strand:+ start:23196 stop:24353 length:1158 start_codon:yes stop_codon:yes gene_type:complete